MPSHVSTIANSTNQSFEIANSKKPIFDPYSEAQRQKNAKTVESLYGGGSKGIETPVENLDFENEI